MPGIQRIKINTAKTGSSFVGLEVDKKGDSSKLTITFPMGYQPTDRYAKDLGEANYSDIQTLIRLIESSKDSHIISDEDENSALPIDDYLYVIEYYIQNSLRFYKETEIRYGIRDSGKISWEKTIKKVRPSLINNQPIYLQTVRRYSSLKENDLITLINKYCVYTALQLFGALYGGLTCEEPIGFFEDDVDFYVDFLNQKIGQTNNDRSKSLFHSMIVILQDQSSTSDEDYVAFGTRDFHVIWEEMIDKVFGTELTPRQKKQFNPRASWRIEGTKDDILASNLRPDTILIDNNVVYILDAKYYRFGVNNENPDISLLPQSADINKQFAYMAYADQKFKNTYDRIDTSVFLLPFNSDDGTLIKKIAEAKCEWYDDKYKLHAYVVDTKTLIHEYLDGEKDLRNILLSIIK